MVSCNLIYGLTENNVKNEAKNVVRLVKERLPFFDFFTIRKRKNNRILARIREEDEDVLFQIGSAGKVKNKLAITFLPFFLIRFFLPLSFHIVCGLCLC